MTVYRSGQVYRIPHDDDSAGDAQGQDQHKSGRPYVLLTDGDGRAPLTLAACSTEGWRVSKGGSAVYVDSAAPTFRMTTLDESTWIFPCELITVTPEDLRGPPGWVSDWVTELKAEKLRDALGFGAGMHDDRAKAAYGSARGRILRLTTDLQTDYSFEYGVVLGDPDYLRHRLDVTLIPLVLAGDLAPIPPSFSVTRGRPWTRQLGTSEIADIMVFVSAIQSVWCGPTEGVRPHFDLLPLGIDAGTMDQIERGLETVFSVRWR